MEEYRYFKAEYILNAEEVERLERIRNAYIAKTGNDISLDKVFENIVTQGSRKMIRKRLEDMEARLNI